MAWVLFTDITQQDRQEGDGTDRAWYMPGRRIVLPDGRRAIVVATRAGEHGLADARAPDQRPLDFAVVVTLP